MQGQDDRLYIATRYRTIDELVAVLQDRCDESSIFVSAVIPRPVGSESKFAVLLADKTPALVGSCVIANVWTQPDGPFHRPGTRLRLRRLTAPSHRVFQRVQLARAVRTFERELGDSSERARARRPAPTTATLRPRTAPATQAVAPRTTPVPNPARLRAELIGTRATPAPVLRAPTLAAFPAVQPLDDTPTGKLPVRRPPVAPAPVTREPVRVTFRGPNPLREDTDASLEAILEDAIDELQRSVPPAGAEPLELDADARARAAGIAADATMHVVLPPPPRRLRAVYAGALAVLVLATLALVLATYS